MSEQLCYSSLLLIRVFAQISQCQLSFVWLLNDSKGLFILAKLGSQSKIRQQLNTKSIQTGLKYSMKGLLVFLLYVLVNSDNFFSKSALLRDQC